MSIQTKFKIKLDQPLEITHLEKFTHAYNWHILKDNYF